MTTDILSFGVLMKRCAELIKQKPHLLGTLSNSLPLRDVLPVATADPWHVRLRILNQHMSFELIHPAHGFDSCITGRIAGGKLYSTYRYHMRPSNYETKFIERFWPMYLPTGCQMGKRKRAVVRTRDGKQQCELVFQGGRRGQYGWMTNVEDTQYFGQELTTCDTDNGRLVTETSELQAAMNGTAGAAAIGWFPLSVREDEFFESVAAVPAVDSQAMTSLARKTLDAAIRFARTCTGWRVQLFPAGVCVKWRRSTPIYPEASDRDEHVTLRESQDQYGRAQLPIVLLYHPKTSRMVQMRIPPVGNAYLDFEDPAVRKRSPLVKDGISSSRQTYSGMLACDLSKGEPQWLSCYGAEYKDKDLASAEKILFNFGRSQDHVLCVSHNCDDAMRQSNMHLLVARRPDDVIAVLEADHLINSLPLC